MLEKMGMDPGVIKRYKNLYTDNITIVGVNDKVVKTIPNILMSLRQGDRPSMFFFAYAIDHLIMFLEKSLSGINMIFLPVLGLVVEYTPYLKPIEETHTFLGFCRGSAACFDKQG